MIKVDATIKCRNCLKEIKTIAQFDDGLFPVKNHVNCEDCDLRMEVQPYVVGFGMQVDKEMAIRCGPGFIEERETFVEN